MSGLVLMFVVRGGEGFRSGEGLGRGVRWKARAAVGAGGGGGEGSNRVMWGAETRPASSAQRRSGEKN